LLGGLGISLALDDSDRDGIQAALQYLLEECHLHELMHAFRRERVIKLFFAHVVDLCQRFSELI